MAAAGACVTYPKRTGANTAPFDDYAQDDRCIDAACIRSKVDAHIAEAHGAGNWPDPNPPVYHSNARGDDKVLNRNEQTIVGPQKPAVGADDATEQRPCWMATSTIVVAGPGKRGEIIHVCADPECEGSQQEAAERQSEKEWQHQQERRVMHRANNLAVPERIPKALTRADYEMLVFAAIDRLEYDDWEAICARYGHRGIEAMQMIRKGRVR